MSAIRTTIFIAQSRTVFTSSMSSAPFVAGHKLLYTTVRGAGVLTPSVLENAQLLLDQDIAPSQVAGELGIKPNTLTKAIRAGRLHERAKKKTFPV
jgi:hypothetical protein